MKKVDLKRRSMHDPTDVTLIVMKQPTVELGKRSAVARGYRCWGERWVWPQRGNTDISCVDGTVEYFFVMALLSIIHRCTSVS